MAIVLNGSLGISAPGTETFGDGTALGGATNPIVSMAKGANNYVQGYVVNNTDAANSSADLVCYPSNGTDSSGWIDMGITGPTFSQAAYGITGANEGYIFMSAPSGASKTGNLVLATDSTGTQNAIKFATGGFGSTTERMRLDASGNLGVGTTTTDPYSLGSTGKSLAIDSSNSSTGSLFSLSSGGTRYGYLFANSSNVVLSAYANIPLLFNTNNTERARFNAGAPILCLAGGNTSATGTGIAFPATQSASSDANTLDDYEEGTFSATITDASGNSATMTSNTLKYTKVGNLVFFTGTLIWSSTAALASGSRLRLGGLPFVSSTNPSDYRSAVNFGTSTSGSFNLTRSQIAFGIDPGNTFIYFTQVSGNNVDGAITKTDIGNAGTLYGITGTYQTNT